MATSDEQLLVGLDLLRQQGSLGTVRDRTDVVALCMPAEYGALAVGEGLTDFEGEFRKQNFRTRYCLCKYCLRTQRVLLVVKHVAIILAEHDAYVLLRGGEDFEDCRTVFHAGDVEYEVFASFLHDAQFAIGHEVLGKHLLLVRHQPGEVRLVLSIYTCHQFDVGTETWLRKAPLLAFLRC